MGPIELINPLNTEPVFEIQASTHVTYNQCIDLYIHGKEKHQILCKIMKNHFPILRTFPIPHQRLHSTKTWKCIYIYIHIYAFSGNRVN